MKIVIRATALLALITVVTPAMAAMRQSSGHQDSVIAHANAPVDCPLKQNSSFNTRSQEASKKLAYAMTGGRHNKSNGNSSNKTTY